MITTNPKNILIADDDLLVRLTMRDTLEDAGHCVSSAMDGVEAISEIGKKAVDLLILDLEIPQMSCFEVMELIRQSSLPKPKVLVITGANIPARVIGTVKDLGAMGILIKGFTPEQLIFRVNRILYSMESNMSRLRAPVSMPVTYSFGNRSGAGFFANLSEGGAFLRTHESLSIGDTIELEFNLPCSKSEIRIKGNIRWSTAQIGANINFGGYGIMFSEIQDWVKAEIHNYVQQVLTEMQPKFQIFS